MSEGDTVCTGWLIKSPPERKLKRYAWRKRWFVLRHGRMSGNPDVLEYYRNDHSSKPIRVIDLSECAVWKHAGPGFVRKEFQNNFVFIVKTSVRTFYLVAETEEEMHVWVYSISQVCNIRHVEGCADTVESATQTTSSLPPSPASSLHSVHAVSSSLPEDDPSTNTVATEETSSESQLLFPPDYLLLSNCESGRVHDASLLARCDSWSNSERSLEQTSCDDVFVDSVQQLPSSNLVQPSAPGDGSQEAPPTMPRPPPIQNRDISEPSRDHFSSSLPETSLNSTIQVDKKQSSLPYRAKELDMISIMPPPRPPKPTHCCEWRQEEQLLWSEHSSIKKPESTVAPRRISLSDLDTMRTYKADVEGQSLRQQEKRLSLNLPYRPSPMYPPTTSPDDGYVPMSSWPVSAACGYQSDADDYYPMNSGRIGSPLPKLPANLEPPPVNRDLKPQRKPQPPPLDLRNLSTIREHAYLTRTHTAPCNRTSFFSPERNIKSAGPYINCVYGEEEESYIEMKELPTANSMNSGTLRWKKKCTLDYLSLDFNSMSTTSVPKKVLLSKEQRVEYVEVDEQKTQALQNTKQEWWDERQYKAPRSEARLGRDCFSHFEEKKTEPEEGAPEEGARCPE